MNDFIDRHKMSCSAFLDELKKSSSKNERPFTVIVNECLNSDLDRFKASVLDVLAPTGEMEAVKMWVAWQVYWEGVNIQRLIVMMQKGMIIRTEPTLISTWINILSESDVHTLYHEYGSAILMKVWSMIDSELRFDVVLKKYNSIYSTGSDPAVWVSAVFKNSKLSDTGDFEIITKERFEAITEKLTPIFEGRIVQKQIIEKM